MAEPYYSAVGGQLFCVVDATPSTPAATTPRMMVLYFQGFDSSGNYPVMKFMDDAGNVTIIPVMDTTGFSSSAPFDIPYVLDTGALTASELVADPGNEYIGVKKNLRLGTVNTGVRALKWYTGTSGGDVDIEPGMPDDGNGYQMNLCDYDRIIKKGASVDLNSTTKQTLYTVPSGVELIVTKVLIRNPSAAVTTAVGSFGFNANADDVTASFNGSTYLGNTSYYQPLPPKTNAVKGSAGGAFGYKGSVAEGSSRTMLVDIFGYFL